MKIIIKTLQGKQFDLEVEESDTVKDIKGKIDANRSAVSESFPAAELKLIALGKIMDDDKKLADYNIKEGGFLVVMI